MRNGESKKGSRCRHSSRERVDIHHRVAKESCKEWTATAHLSWNHNLNAFVYYFSVKERY